MFSITLYNLSDVKNNFSGKSIHSGEVTCITVIKKFYFNLNLKSKNDSVSLKVFQESVQLPEILYLLSKTCIFGFT